MDLVKTGKFLQELRKEKGFTQEQLAEKIGVARRTVSRWETGSNMPDLDILMELSDLYEVKTRLLKRMHWLFIAGLVGFIVFLATVALGLNDTDPYEAIGSFGLGIAFGMIIIGVIFTSRYAIRIREFKMRMLGKSGK